MRGVYVGRAQAGKGWQWKARGGAPRASAACNGQPGGRLPALFR
jgi:hypothetical protein